MSSLKEQIVREMIDLLQRAPEGRHIDLGSLVMFLDDEALGWIFGQTLHTYPLFEYCQPYTNWTEAQFEALLAPLEARLADFSLQMELSDPPLNDADDSTVIQMSPYGGQGAMAAAMVTGGFSSFSEDGFTEMEREALISMILRCTNQTPVEDIIDPGKLRGFLEETIDEMKEGDVCNLQMLWDILLDAPGISQDILIPVFLLMEREEPPVPLEFPSLVQGLPSKIRESMLAQLGVVEESPAEPQVDPNRFMVQSNKDKAPAIKSRSPDVPAPRKTTPTMRPERPKPKTNGPQRAKRSPSPRATTEGGGNVVKLAVIAVLVIAVIGGAFYFLKNRKPGKIVLEGRAINVTVWRSIFPAAQVTLKKRKVMVLIRPIFLTYKKSQRVTVSHRLWLKLRGLNPSINSMVLYKPDGSVLQTFGSR